MTARERMGDGRRGLGADAQRILRSYIGLYRRRAQKGGGLAFTSPEPNALAALATQRAAVALPRGIDGEAAVRMIDELTRQVLVDHQVVGMQIAGYAWAETYGALPLSAPPLATLDAVVIAGAQPGAIGGLYGSAWRALFLSRAIPLLHAGTRPLAIEQLHRWMDYMRPRIASVATASAPTISELSQRARIAATAGELAALIEDESLMQSTTMVVSGLLEIVQVGTPAGGEQLGSTHLGQLAAAAAAVGDRGAAISLLERLTGGFLDQDRGMFRRAPGDDRIESSPWLPLAVAAVLEDTSDVALTGSRLRRALVGARRRTA